MSGQSRDSEAGHGQGAKRPCAADADGFCDAAWAGIAAWLKLSARQAQTLRGVLADLSEKEIARELGISPATVHTHIHRLHEKLGVHSRLGLASAVTAAYLAWRNESPPPAGCHLRSRLEDF